MTRSKHAVLWVVLGSLAGASCHHPPEESHCAIPVAAVGEPASRPVATTPVKGTTLADSVQSAPAAAVLTVGLFHADEVATGSARRTWMGLFVGKTGPYLQQTAIQVARVRDEIIDGDDGAETGWAVTTTNPDSSLLLIAGLPYLQDRALVPVSLPKRILLPGERTDFTYQGRSYAFFATGRLQKGESEADGVAIQDYKLFFSAFSAGQERRQLLVAHPAFDEEMVDLLFVGDLDGDNVPDVILNKSNHYNLTNPALFLSTPAAKGALLQEVGEHISVGC